MRGTLIIVMAMVWACEGPRGPAGPPGQPADARVADAARFDKGLTDGPNPDTAPIDGRLLDGSSADGPPDVGPDAQPDSAPDAQPDRGPDAQPDAIPDLGPLPCPPWTPPAGLGGPIDAELSVEATARWMAYRGAREQERMRAEFTPDVIRARYRIEQSDLDRGCVTPAQAVDLGRALFLRAHEPADGLGSVDRTTFRRFQIEQQGGPDALRCADCHWKGGFAGGGDRADNAFFFGDGNDIETQDARNPPALWGAGWAQLIAEEMTIELANLAAAAEEQAAESNAPVTVELRAKGTDFGRLTVTPDGEWDTAEISGIDPDLVVRPFGWKGTFRTLREFVIGSLHGHFGLQSDELLANPGEFQIGDGVAEDPDGDGVQREITEGQLTAIAAFLATLDAPTIIVPGEGDGSAPLTAETDFVDAPEFTERWLRGAAIFEDTGCAECHTPFMTVRETVWKSTAGVSGSEYVLDLAEFGARPHPEPQPDGEILVPVFSDFKRHEMGLYLRARNIERGVPEGEYLTRRLWGVAQTSPYLHDGSATTFDEAIAMHGGPGSEAQFAAEAFAALSDSRKSSLRVFLLGLRRAPSIRVR